MEKKMRKTYFTYMFYILVSAFFNFSYASQFSEEVTEVEAYAQGLLTEKFIDTVKNQTIEDEDNPNFIRRWNALTFGDQDINKIHHTLGKFLTNLGKPDKGIMDDFLEVSHEKFEKYKNGLKLFKNESLFRVEKAVISFVNENSQYAQNQINYGWPTTIED